LRHLSYLTTKACIEHSRNGTKSTKEFMGEGKMVESRKWEVDDSMFLF